MSSHTGTSNRISRLNNKFIPDYDSPALITSRSDAQHPDQPLAFAHERRRRNPAGPY